jgi:hypothetical protein
MPRRPLHVQDHGLGDRLAALPELDDSDRDNLLNVLDALITRKRLRPSQAAKPAERAGSGREAAQDPADLAIVRRSSCLVDGLKGRL